ncbi:MAG: DUF1566 domain-containing protein [Deltaproteobacteria bacterium]|nr:DUF1566 domain-containing protein [Deltaproteobacteria bacterium]
MAGVWVLLALPMVVACGVGSSALDTAAQGDLGLDGDGSPDADDAEFSVDDGEPEDGGTPETEDARGDGEASECVPETCNARDDDCDGTADDGFPCVRGETRPCVVASCHGIQACTSSCEWAECAVAIVDSCNGADDDCDTATDEDFDCISGISEPCNTSCSTPGTHSCGSTCIWQACQAVAAETCDNLADDDCDGGTDEGCLGAACITGSDCTDAGLVCNENWGICVVADCTGRSDFVPCEIITSPDRSYDICSSGECKSPGCGIHTCNVPGPGFPPADTGQRTCYDGTLTIVCPGAAGSTDCESVAFCGQDAQYGWDVAHARSERYRRSVPAAGEPVVLDTVTGLEWQGCAWGMSGDATSCSGFASEGDWYSALRYCDLSEWGGHSDWRLPDHYALASISDHDAWSPAIDLDAFPGTPALSFWSSSTCSGLAGNALVASNASVVPGPKTYSGGYIRCVRGGWPEPVARFLRSDAAPGNPVVADAVTGVVWQGCAAGRSGGSCTAGSATTMDWQAALTYCQVLAWAGYTDWYLPNAGELSGIADSRRPFGAIDPTAFPETPRAKFWTATSLAMSAPNAWRVWFDEGTLSADPKSDALYVRCARAGP